MQHTEVRYLGGKKFEAKNRNHTIIIDLPVESGGSDKGPTPPEIFIDSLASCVGMYVIGYCSKTGINTEGLKIKVDWEKELETKPVYIKKIDIKISLPNADIGARKEALLKIAHSCTIHQTIEKHPWTTIELE